MFFGYNLIRKSFSIGDKQDTPMGKKAIDMPPSLVQKLEAGQCLTTAEVAADMCVCEARIRQLLREKRLPGVKKGRDWIVTQTRFATVRSLADFIGLSESHTRALAKKGEIAGAVPKKIGRDLLFVKLQVNREFPDETYFRKRRKKRRREKREV